MTLQTGLGVLSAPSHVLRALAHTSLLVLRLLEGKPSTWAPCSSSSHLHEDRGPGTARDRGGTEHSAPSHSRRFVWSWVANHPAGIYRTHGATGRGQDSRWRPHPEVGSSAPFQLSLLGKRPVLADVSRNSPCLRAQVMLRGHVVRSHLETAAGLRKGPPNRTQGEAAQLPAPAHAHTGSSSPSLISKQTKAQKGQCFDQVPGCGPGRHCPPHPHPATCQDHSCPAVCHASGPSPP